MADKEPKRWVIVSMIHGAVERTEREIEELKAHGLFVRDATGPEDSHSAPVPQLPGPRPAGDKPAS